MNRFLKYIPSTILLLLNALVIPVNLYTMYTHGFKWGLVISCALSSAGIWWMWNVRLGTKEFVLALKELKGDRI